MDMIKRLLNKLEQAERAHAREYLVHYTEK